MSDPLTPYGNNTVRLSAGIEKTGVLLKDLEQALSKLEIESRPKTRINTVQQPSKKKGGNYADVRI